MSRRVLVALLAGLLAVACGARQPGSAARRPPEDPWSWVPERATVIGRVSLAELRGTALWTPAWSELERQERIDSWVSLDKIERVTFGGSGETREDTSYIAALEGTFAANELEVLAVRDGLTPELRGPLTLYRRKDGVWAQVSPKLVLTCTPDRTEELVARATGAGGLVRAGGLYRSLADKVGLEDAHFAVLAEDPDGEAQGTIDRRASRYGFSSITRDASRVGLALETGATYRVVGVGEATSSARADDLEASVRNTLDGLAGNVLVRLIGVSKLLAKLETTREGSYVFVRGALPEAELERAIERVQGALDVAARVTGAPPGGR